MLQFKILFALQFLLLGASALPQWPAQQSLHLGAVMRLVEWISSSNTQPGFQVDQPGLSFSPYENQTIWQVISEDPKYSKLVKAIKFADAGIDKLLDDDSQKMTFFAIPDWAIKFPPRDMPSFSDQSMGLADAIGLVDSLDDDDDDDDDDEDKERRKRILKAIIATILRYHVLPDEVDMMKLAEVSSFPTKLVIPFGLDKQPQRIRIESRLIPPSTTVNMFSKVIESNLWTKNGVIHVLNNPLFPPLTAFRGVYLLMREFSYFTSVTQRSGLTTALDLLYQEPKHKGDEPTFKGAGVVTTFVPANRAFQALPTKLQLYLFSPFGERVLKKLLQFHVVPDFALLSDWTYNATTQDSSFSPVSSALDPALLDDVDYNLASSLYPDYVPSVFVPDARSSDVIATANYSLPTLLKDHCLEVNVIKYNVSLPIPTRPHRIVTHVYVNRQRVAVPDIPALNGAVHVLGKLLDPRKKHDQDMQNNDWEDWEEWLPRWAEGLED